MHLHVATALAIEQERILTGFMLLILQITLIIISLSTTTKTRNMESVFKLYSHYLFLGKGQEIVFPISTLRVRTECNDLFGPLSLDPIINVISAVKAFFQGY